MSEKERSSKFAMLKAISNQRHLSGEADRSNLNATLVKSSLWKKNTLQKIAQSAEPITTHDVRTEGEIALDTERSVPLGENDDSASQEERRKSAILRRRTEEIERLRREIAKLNEENARLTELHQNKLDAHRNELLEFQRAFDEFQQQSDLLLTELDQDNERLRLECKVNNKRSLL
ncbi:MAG: hypothetical protein OEO71_08135 [Gammaproteobacteria bacterium]|nr:hypothetical protein [Gammaproteobacteria bacterium]